MSRWVKNEAISNGRSNKFSNSVPEGGRGKNSKQAADSR